MELPQRWRLPDRFRVLRVCVGFSCWWFQLVWTRPAKLEQWWSVEIPMPKLEQERVALRAAAEEGQPRSAAIVDGVRFCVEWERCACGAEWPNSGGEVQSLNSDCAQTASFWAALATNPAMAQLERGFMELVQQFVRKPKTHVQMWKRTMERLKTSVSAVRQEEAGHEKISRTVAGQREALARKPSRQQWLQGTLPSRTTAGQLRTPSWRRSKPLGKREVLRNSTCC